MTDVSRLRTVPQSLRRRFRIERFLGAGAEGSVFLARDRSQGGLPVSLKILERPSARALPELRLRLSAVARIDHPNIARILDFDVADRSRDLWVASEYVPGEDLRRFGAHDARPPGSVFPTLLECVARALLQFHGRGLVHGDVRPANMLCAPTPEGPMIKLIDGGVSVQPHESSSAQLQHLRRQDLRFTGSAFYTALTGKDADRCVPPRQWNPAIPDWINRLILRLLIPYSPEGIGTADLFLEEVLRQSRGPKGGGIRINLSKPPLIGRSRELSVLREAVDRLGTGRQAPGTILVSGDPGSGKTALLREGQVYGRARGIPVFAARSPAGDGLPYEPLLEIAQSVSSHFGWSAPAFSRTPGTPRHCSLALTRLLRRAAGRGPCVISIDDAQAIVPDSAEILRATAEALAAGPAPAPILFLVAVRGTPATTRWTRSFEGLPCRPLPLGGLEPEASAAIVRITLGLPPDEAMVRRLHSLSGGNPGLLLASLELLRPRMRREGATVGVPSLERLPVARDAEASATQIIAHLEPRLRRAARELSPHPGFLKRSIARDVLGVDDAEDLLQKLISQGVLHRLSLTSYEWTSTALRLALAKRLSRGRRERLHRRFARAGQKLLPPGTLGSHLFQAYHLARSASPERAHRPALECARLLASVFRYAEAADYYELALRLLPPGRMATVESILRSLQAACRKGGLHRKGRRVSLALLSRRPSLSQFAAAAHFIRVVDGPAAAVRFIDRALRSRCRRSPCGLALLQSKRAWALSMTGRFEEADRSAEHAEAYLSECRDAVTAIDVYMDIGAVRYLQGQLDPALDYFLTALKLTRKARDTSRQGPLYDNLSLVLRSRLQLQAAQRYARKALAIKLRRGLSLDAAVSRMVLGAILDDLGDHEAGQAELLKARDVFRARGDRLKQAWATYGLGSIHLALENHVEAVEWFDRALAEAPTDAPSGLPLAVHAGKAQVFLATGDFGKAEACLRAGSALPASRAEYDARLAWLRAQALFALHEGRLPQARRLLHRAGPELERSQARSSGMQFTLIGLAVDLAAGKPEAARDRAEALIPALESAGLRALLCEARLLCSEACLATGEVRRARFHAARARRLLDFQAQPSYRIRYNLIRSRLGDAGADRLRPSLDAFRLATKHELKPLIRAAALQLARGYEAREDYASAIHYYQEAGRDAGNRSA